MPKNKGKGGKSEMDRQRRWLCSRSRSLPNYRRSHLPEDKQTESAASSLGLDLDRDDIGGVASERVRVSQG